MMIVLINCVHTNLSDARFHSIKYFGGYDANTPLGDQYQLMSINKTRSLSFLKLNSYGKGRWRVPAQR